MDKNLKTVIDFHELLVGFGLFSLARAAVYKIRPYERGLHLRGGAFVGIDQPGWHFQIPFVDTVIGLNVVERPGLIDQLAAMTADDVTMDVSLLYTYRVVDPVRYALEETEPDQIVALRQTLAELDGKGPLTEQYLQVLIAQELRENSKWIISSSGTMPIIDLRDVSSQVQPTATATAP